MYDRYVKYSKVVDESSDIIAVVYESKKPAKKDQSKLEPFIKQNIIHVGLAPIQDKLLYPNGLYTAFDDKKSDKRWLFFVSPSLVKCTDNDHAFLAANHYTFCLDQSDKDKECHFHSTKYYCMLNDEVISYKTNHEKDFFSDKLLLPSDETKILKHHYGATKDSIVKLMKFPYLLNIQSGGARRKSTTKQVARPITNIDFCSLWSRCGFKGMRAFGVRKNKRIHWTVCLIEKGRHARGVLQNAFAFDTSADEEDHEVKLQEIMADRIRYTFDYML